MPPPLLEHLPKLPAATDPHHHLPALPGRLRSVSTGWLPLQLQIWPGKFLPGPGSLRSVSTGWLPLRLQTWPGKFLPCTCLWRRQIQPPFHSRQSRVQHWWQLPPLHEKVPCKQHSQHYPRTHARPSSGQVHPLMPLLWKLQAHPRLVARPSPQWMRLLVSLLKRLQAPRKMSRQPHRPVEQALWFSLGSGQGVEANPPFLARSGPAFSPAHRPAGAPPEAAQHSPRLHSPWTGGAPATADLEAHHRAHGPSRRRHPWWGGGP
mmetsp:Transcript_47677/g.153392  ORF Transcript_47677/g.153392 Transcript_47677/m.153392 type:complete len:263 (+) Transcript_47677:1784-2572(+)